MPPLQRRIHFWAAGLLGSWLVCALHRTWRVRVLDRDGVLDGIRRGQRKAVMAFWHRHLLPLVAHYRHYPFVVPVSEHRDGEYVAQVMERFGIYSVRGSTTRGSLKVIRGLVAQVGQGRTPALTPDGPRGPRFSVQPGFLLLARRCRLPVYAVGVWTTSAWVLPSWDAFVIPKPWASVAIVIEQALSDATRDAAGDTSRLCELLRERLFQAEEAARESLGG